MVRQATPGKSYFEEYSGRSAARLLTRDEPRCIAFKVSEKQHVLRRPTRSGCAIESLP